MYMSLSEYMYKNYFFLVYKERYVVISIIQGRQQYSTDTKPFESFLAPL